ncbi:MAG TPA: hypothetical protein VIH91_05390, partial [Terriglobales bacterium]
WFTGGNTRKLAAPVIEIDHIKNNFVGGRWVMVLADLERPLASADLSRLAQRALEGAREIVVQPTTALFLAGETPSFQVRVNRFASKPAALRLELTDSAESGSPVTQSFPLDITQYPFITSVQMPAQPQLGLHTVTAKFLDGSTPIAQYRTGYWVRDNERLLSGPRVTLNQNFFSGQRQAAADCWHDLHGERRTASVPDAAQSVRVGPRLCADA